MKTEVINSLNDGINVKSDPSAISEGGMADCVGFDLTKAGIIEFAGGLADNDISALLPAITDVYFEEDYFLHDYFLEDHPNHVQCFHKFYIGTTLYVLATTTTGLYVNGVLKDVTFTGRFKGVSILNNIYICNGTYARRFDGTNVYQWGITAPTDMLSVAAGEHLTKPVDNFETLTTWTANQVGCVVAAETTIFKEGTQSAKITVAASALGTTYRPLTIDATEFVGGQESSIKDYLSFWLYIDDLACLEYMKILFDVGDGSFLRDYFSYEIVSSGTDNLLQTLGLGKTSDVSPQETVPPTNEDVTPTGYWEGEVWVDTTPLNTVKTYTITLTQKSKKTVVDPVTIDQALSFWRKSSLFELKSATWVELRIPKSLFIQTGNATVGWNTIASVKIEVAATSLGSVNVYLDTMKFIGGSDLVGDYWFMYSWGRMDSGSIVLHESSVSRNNTTKQYNILGPVTFDREPLSYESRPLSSDPQVNCGVIYGIGGGLIDFWAIAEIADNTTTVDTLYDVGDEFTTRKLVSKGNEPAPPGTDIVLFRNKIWMVGDPSYPTIVRSSDILADGTIAPEAWPTRNGYELAENHGPLTNINILNKQIVVKGQFGEWSLKVNDPVDYLQVVADRVSDKGLLAQDGVIILENSHIYPSTKGFVQSDGSQAAFILPEIEPLIEASLIGTAKGVSIGLVNYFSYETTEYGERTAKVDLYTGKPRFSNLNDILFEWFSYDPVGSKVYAVIGGRVFLLDEGYTNEYTPDKELYAFLKSRVYRPGGMVCWTKMRFDYDTAGYWFRLEVYVDSKLVSSTPFKSSERKSGIFNFGPRSGYDFQFIITGDYKALGKIHFPIRIYHSG